MTNKHDGYTTRPFPLMRRVVVDAARVGQRKHLIHGLIEVDVTRARRFLREHKERTGEALSFTALIITCLGKAVDEDKSLNAYRDWRDRLITFDDVDITTLTEIDTGGQTFPLAHIIRAANKRDFRDIHNEIRSVQSKPQDDFSTGKAKFMRTFLLLPAFIRDLFYRFLYSRPHLLKEYTGTVSVTAVGMFGKGGGWGIPLTSYNLTVTLGGIAEKPAFVEGRVEAREFLCMTVSADHDVIDGAPATRFAGRLRELIESGYGLDDADVNHGRSE